MPVKSITIYHHENLYIIYQDLVKLRARGWINVNTSVTDKTLIHFWNTFNHVENFFTELNRVNTLLGSF